MSLPDGLTDALRTNAYDQFILQKKLIDDRTWCCCANCFSLKETICSENNLSIPPQVAVTGCAKWDGLPF